MENIMKVRYRDDGQKIVKEAVLVYIPKKEYKIYLTKDEIKELKKDEYYGIINGYYKTKRLSARNYNDDVSVMTATGRIQKMDVKKAVSYWEKGETIIIDF
jgi:hypothetical protein